MFFIFRRVVENIKHGFYLDTVFILIKSVFLSLIPSSENSIKL